MRTSVLLACIATATATNEAVTPVQKVIQLLNGMLEKGKKEKHEEQVMFSAYKQFCDDTSEEKTVAIKKAESLMESLAATIRKEEANAARLASEIGDHENDIAQMNSDIKAATKVRKGEKADYDAIHKDYSESISALERAIGVLKKQNYDRKQASDSLLQVSQKSLIPAAAKKAIDAFLQGTSADPLDVRAPEANGYEFQSGGVIEMLEKLLDKFQDELYTVEKEETNAKHAFDMLTSDLRGSVKQTEDTVAAKNVNKATALKTSAEAKGDLSDTTSSRDDDKAYLADLVATCETKSSDFEARQKLRAQEIEAIEKAIEILSSDDVSGNAAKHLPTLAQTSFLQMKMDTLTPQQEKAVEYLNDRAAVIHSHVLAAIAVKAAADPFTKVKRMIQDLITRLMEEANEEAEHKGWCDKELATNKATRKEKSEGVELLTAEADELIASNAKLTKRINTLAAEIKDLDATMLEATKIRADDKAENLQTIADAKAGQEAVSRALRVLKDFYAKAAQATSLMQAPADAPKIFDDTPYTGMQGENGGVVGMLEVIESDFARLEAETKSAEETAQSNYDKLMTKSKVAKSEKSTEKAHKTAKRQDQEETLSNTKADLEGTQKELDTALEVYDKLKPTCVNAGVSFEDRVKRREEEIQSLKEALRILQGEELSM